MPAEFAPVYAGDVSDVSDESDARFAADLEAARGGDGAAFWRLLGPHQGKLYGYIRKALNFAADADDVYQETVLRAYRFLSDFRPGSFPVWLFTIAHNEVHRWQRRAAARRSEPLDEVRAAAPVADPHEQVLVGEVYAAAAQLPERVRRVFFLYYDSGFAVAEVAAVTGLTQTNVKFMLFRARRLLRARLGGLDGRP